jgi:hypothetical protein
VLISIIFVMFSIITFPVASPLTTFMPLTKRQVRARKKSAALETQLQEAHDTKTSLEAEIKLLQALPAQIRELEVQCARKERELSLLQASLSQKPPGFTVGTVLTIARRSPQRKRKRTSRCIVPARAATRLMSIAGLFQTCWFR